jgi:hypothetical protein
LEYREWYVEQAASAIPQWASSHAPTTYAGYWVDHRNGGIIRVGFTQNQSTQVAALAQSGSLVAPSRIAGFSSAPTHSYSELVVTQSQVANQAGSIPGFTRVGIDLKENVVKVGTTGSVQSAETALDQAVGSSAPVQAYSDVGVSGNSQEDRDRVVGRIRAGDRIWWAGGPRYCTAGFGAWITSGENTGQPLYKHFLLTAAHCGALENLWLREALNPNTGKEESQKLGRVRRNGIVDQPQVDGEAILLQGEADGWAPRQIYLGPKEMQPVKGTAVPAPGMIVCASGVKTDEVLCGPVLGPPEGFGYGDPPVEGNPQINLTWEVPIDIREKRGDSGAPVWQQNTGNALGLWNAGTRPSYVTPLLPMETDSSWENILGPQAPGILAKLGFTPGNLTVAP